MQSNTQAGTPGHGDEASVPFPLTRAQLDLWHAQQLHPDVPLVVAQYVDLRGDLDVDLLQRVSAQAGLELGSGFIRFVEDGHELRQVVDPALDASIWRVDLRGENNPVAAAQRWMRGDFARPVALLTDRLVQAAVLRIEDQRWFWYSRAHHLVLDGYGAMVLTGRIAELYTADRAGTPVRSTKDRPIQEFSDTEDLYHQSSRIHTDRGYWSKVLADDPTVTTLSQRHWAPPAVSHRIGGLVPAALNRMFETAVTRLDTAESVLVTAAFAAYVAQFTGRDDIRLSLPVAARTTVAMRRAAGTTSNVVPLPVHIDGTSTVAELINQVGLAITGALRHQRYRHTDMVRDLGGGAAGFGPWVNIMLFHRAITLGQASGELMVLNTGVVDDLAVTFYLGGPESTRRLELEANPGRYDDRVLAEHHARLLAFLPRLLSAAPADLMATLDIVTPEERHRCLVDWNDTRQPGTDLILTQLLNTRTTRGGDTPAFRCGDRSLSRAEFEAKVNRLARYLVGIGVGPETRVALSLPRGLDLVVAIHAVIHAGGAFLTLDREDPPERVRAVLTESSPTCLLVLSADAPTVDPPCATVAVDTLDLHTFAPTTLTDIDRRHPLRADNTAYVVYTSGSTGTPKGIAVSHAAVSNHLLWLATRFEINSSDIYLATTAATFDVSLWGMLLPVMCGATLVMADDRSYRDPQLIAEQMHRHSVTITDFVPSILALAVANTSAREWSTLRHVLVIGEVLDPSTAAACRAHTPAGIHNLYGPAETAISVTHWRTTEDDTAQVPIGTPIWNTQVYVLDSALRPAAVGAVGELYIGGTQLARGYLARPDLSAQRFVANPFRADGQRLYRTGDLVRWRADGVLCFIGRLDTQVKIRGQRIELDEIAGVLRRHPTVAAAVAIAKDQALLAYAVPRSGRRLAPRTLVRHCARWLPRYMVPAVVVALESIPLARSGKLDVRALPDAVAEPAIGDDFALRTASEQAVAAIMADQLGLELVARDHGLFDLGASSLDAVAVSMAIRAQWGVEVPLATLFNGLTVAELAALIDAGELPTVASALRSRVHDEPAPSSDIQRQMWFTAAFSPDSRHDLMAATLRLHGYCDVRRLQEALLDVLDRHQPLRTVFTTYPPDPDSPLASEGGIAQRVISTREVHLELSVIDLSVDEMPAKIAEFTSGAIDLTTELPFKIAVFRPGSEDITIAVVVHHIAADGWSLPILARDLSLAYQARTANLPPVWEPLPVTYLDYTVWHRELLGDLDDPRSLAARQSRYWKSVLTDAPTRLTLPSDRPLPDKLISRAETTALEVDVSLHRAVQDLARAHFVSPFMVLQAVLAVVLSQVSGMTDIVVGTPIAGRGEPQLDAMVGMFVNTLALRTPIDRDERFVDLLDRVRTVDLEAFQHTDLSFGRVVEAVQPARSPAHHPIYQVLFVVRSDDPVQLDLPGLEVTVTEIGPADTEFDLQVTLTEKHEADRQPGGITVAATFAADRYTVKQVSALLQRYRRALASVSSNPYQRVHDIDLLAGAERQSLLARRGQMPPTSANVNVWDLVIEQAAARPDATAILTDTTAMTFQRLSAAVNRLARELVSRGVGPESVVAVGVRRSIESVLAAYAVLHAGGVYLPIDIDHPTERLRAILDDSAPTCIVTTSADLGSWHDAAGRARHDVVLIDTMDTETISSAPLTPDERPRPVRPDNIAYIIYTSGSTGRPKGVQVTYRALNTQIAWIAAYLDLDHTDVVLHRTRLGFDVSLWELFAAPTVGAAVVVAAPEADHDVSVLVSTIVRHRPTVASFVPSALAVFLDVARPEHCVSLRSVLAAGEALAGAIVERFARFSKASLHNLYGPTEFAIHATATIVLASLPDSIGTPAADSIAYVLDDRLHPVPTGVIGELYLSGSQIARGYRADTARTAGSFVANPFAVESVSLMYRTGDLVSWNADGNLLFHGRTDTQRKIRGQRVELGEIETVLTADPAVSAAVVHEHPGPAGPQLVGYVVPVMSGFARDELRRRLSRVLPRHMVPTTIVELAALPLTSVGKIDRAALVPPDSVSRPSRPPQTFTQHALVGAFVRVLGIDAVGLDDDFFELGGNSLLATLLVSALHDSLNIRIPVQLIFEYSSVVDLAAAIDQPAQPISTDDRPPLTVRPHPQRLPLAPSQRRLWFLNRFDPESPMYNIAVGLRIDGELDPHALQAAVLDVMDRHHSLRTVYPDAEEPEQKVLPSTDVEIDISTISTSADDLDAHLSRFASGNFDLTHEVPIRVRLFRLGATAHVLGVVVHHIAADGWSLRLLLTDLLHAYRSRVLGQESPFSALPLQYIDYALWQQRLLGDQRDPESRVAQKLSYWKSELAEVSGQPALPTDRPYPAILSFRGKSVTHTFDSATVSKLTAVANGNSATAFMVAHTALAVLLARISGASQVVIGTPAHGRYTSELTSVVGMFVNTVPLVTSVDPAMSFVALLARTRERTLQALAHADVPFDTIVEHVNPVRSASWHPLFQVTLDYDNFLPLAAPADLPLTVTTVDVHTDIAKYDLQFTIRPSEVLGVTSLHLEIVFATGLYDESTVLTLAQRLESVLCSAVADPHTPVGDLKILNDSELEDLLSRIGPAGLSARMLPDLLSATAYTDPTSVAVVHEHGELSYGELQSRASRLARVLIDAGIGPEDVVAIAISRSVNSIVAMWAIAYAGAAFLPVDPAYPSDRINYLLNNSATRVGLTTYRDKPGMPAEIRWIVLDDPEVERVLDALPGTPVLPAERQRTLGIDHPAYLIYTSGSTGLPKGVLITHQGLHNLTATLRERFGATPRSRILHFAAIGFDAAIMELLIAFTSGASVIVAPTTIYGGTELTRLLRDHRVTHAFLTPAALSTIDPTDLDDLHTLICGGDTVAPTVIEQWAGTDSGHRRRVFDAYGPTEATIAAHISTALDPGQPVTIGEPIRGVHSVIIDDRLGPVPIGAVGELYLAGDALARGYLHRSSQTACSFVANPFGPPGTRMYRTGDLARWTATGTAEHLGRRDFQVKVRGYRVELGEIDSALSALPSVRFAVTTMHAGSNDHALVSYVLTEPPGTGDPETLRRSVAQRLPAHMVPAMIILLTQVPLTANGKLDRRQLPQPAYHAWSKTAPGTLHQRAVAEAFQDILGLPWVGLHDRFFELGGNSLLATHLVARLSRSTGQSIGVRHIFANDSVAALALLLDSASASTESEPDPEPLAVQQRPDRIPLSPAQSAMWFLQRFRPSSGAYNIAFALAMSGPLDIVALELALADLVERHEILRTIYPEGPREPHQIVLPAHDADQYLQLVDLADDDIDSYAKTFAAQPINIVDEVPFRVRLLCADVHRATLLVVIHHIAADGMSLRPLIDDLTLAYNARTLDIAPEWAPLSIQYADYAIWRRAQVGTHSPLVQHQLTYWRNALDGAPDHIPLPFDRPRPSLPSYSAGYHTVELPENVLTRADQLARNSGCTPFVVVHAAFALLLSQLSGADDLVIGTPVAGREHGTSDLIGMFVDTRVLRTDLRATRTFTDVLHVARASMFGAMTNDAVSFDHLVELLAPPRVVSRNPIFQVMLAYQNMPTPALELPGLAVHAVAITHHSARFDLQLTVTEPARPGMTARAEFSYATDLFDSETVARFARQFLSLLATVTATPDIDMRLLDIDVPAETIALTSHHSSTLTPDSPDLLATLLTDSDAVAITHAGQAITYAVLERRANQLARYLITTTGIGPEHVVAIAIERGLDFVIAVHAVVKTGAAFAPVDVRQPDARTAAILDTTSMSLIVTSRTPLAHNSTAPVLDIDTLILDDLDHTPISDTERTGTTHRDNLAYILHTSGSTGTPKAVAVSRGALSDHLNWMIDRYQIGLADVYLHKTSLTFDVALWGVFLPACVGATIALLDDAESKDPEQLADALFASGATLTDFVPTHLAAFARSATRHHTRSLRHLFVIGETLPSTTLDNLDAICDAPIDNLYGPTETTVAVTAWTVAPTRARAPIGTPPPHTGVHVLDRYLRPTPVGGRGELYVRGPQLARGYHSASLTASHFVADPFGAPGTRMYRTGDLARWTFHDTDPVLQHLGRNDDQVKILGVRLELAEVEVAMRQAPEVVDAAAVVAATGDRLLAYVVAEPDRVIDIDALRMRLLACLPPAAIPASIVVVDSLPLTEAGKLDRKRLDTTVTTTAPATDRYARTLAETIVAATVADVLGLDQVGVEDNLFALGGNSMSATLISYRLRVTLGKNVPVHSILTDPTPAGIARAAHSAMAVVPWPKLAKGQRPKHIPLSRAQQRLWHQHRDGRPHAATTPFMFTVVIEGHLDLDIAQTVLNDVVTQFEILRTTFPESHGSGTQLIAPPTHHPLHVHHGATEADALTFVNTPIEIEYQVPFSVGVFVVDAEASILAVAIHPIAADRMSIGLLARFTMDAYAARVAGEPPLPTPLPVQYADFTLWNLDHLGSDDDEQSLAARQIAYWTTMLGENPALELPLDRPRPLTTAMAGAQYTWPIPARTHRAINALAADSGTTVFQVAHAALAVVLAGLAGVDDLIVATRHHGRDEAELAPTVGVFTNYLALRTRLYPHATFRNHLHAVQHVDIQAMDHSDVSFERVAEILGWNREPAVPSTPRFVLEVFDTHCVRFGLAGLQVHGHEHPRPLTTHDLHFVLIETADEHGHPAGIIAELTYSADLFDPATAAQIADTFTTVLETVTSDPDITVGELSPPPTIATATNGFPEPQPQEHPPHDQLDNHHRPTTRSALQHQRSHIRHPQCIASIPHRLAATAGRDRTACVVDRSGPGAARRPRIDVAETAVHPRHRSNDRRRARVRPTQDPNTRRTRSTPVDPSERIIRTDPIRIRGPQSRAGAADPDRVARQQIRRRVRHRNGDHRPSAHSRTDDAFGTPPVARIRAGGSGDVDHPQP